MQILYKGNILDLRKKIQTKDKCFHNEDSLWITSPEQRNLPYMKFVGGFPNEYCIDIKDITDEYSILTHLNEIIGVIIKENNKYIFYGEAPCMEELEGNTLEEAEKYYWF